MQAAAVVTLPSHVWSLCVLGLFTSCNAAAIHSEADEEAFKAAHVAMHLKDPSCDDLPVKFSASIRVLRVSRAPGGLR